MKDTLLHTVKTFLTAHFLPGRPLLLAYSGGPDSKALLYLLLACKRFFPLELHLAHVDHSWRPASSYEALILQQEAAAHHLSFHLQTLSHLPTRNLEEEGRTARYTFFKQVYSQINAQALLLAHQADDHAETVLKRIFEGSHLKHAAGMTPISTQNGMVIWRPLLTTLKKRLGEWLEQKDLTTLQDPTNQDPRFLRGRMRQDLLPFLSEKFGKQVSENLSHLGRMADELSLYFSRKLKPCFSTLQHHAEGVHWDLSSFCLEQVEWEYLLKEWLQDQKLSLSREIFQELVRGLQCKGRCQFQLKEKTLILEKGILKIKSL